jgi:type IX secretion system PorP/SprF family membrane protein
MPMYSQYMMNTFLINPATAGADGFTTMNLTAREQWIGFDGDAPRTHSICMQTRIIENPLNSNRSAKKQYFRKNSGRVGIGGYLFNDQYGVFDQTGGQFTYAYHIPFDYAQLSFGIGLRAYQLTIDKDRITLEEPDDELVRNMDPATFIPEFDFGVFYTYPNLYAGLSVSQLSQSLVQLWNKGVSLYRGLREYKLMGGYIFDISPEFKAEPSLLYKTTERFATQVDINSRFYYKEDYWVGFSYRHGFSSFRSSGGALIMMAGIQIDRYHFAYSFDYATTSIQKFHYGSHEFMVAINLGDQTRRYKYWDRY